MIRVYLTVWLRAFVIVTLTALNVRMVSQGLYRSAFVTGGLLSAVWWFNTGVAAHNRERGLWFAYAFGAACGTIMGMWLGR